MARQVIGIDFGTSKSSVSLLAMGTRYAPILLEFGGGRKVVPTALLLDPDNGEVLHWGWDAYASHRREKTSVETNFKRELDGGSHAETLCRLFMSKLAEKVKMQQNVHELDVAHFATVVGVPANWSTKQRELTVRIAEEVGFPDVEILEEPIAAMHNLRVQEKSVLKFGTRSEHYMVVDFGGGTLDICIVKTAELGRNPQIVATDGDPALGGLDFDELIEGWFLRQCEVDKKSLDATDQSSLRSRIIEIKHEMSSAFAHGNVSSTHTVLLADGEHRFIANQVEFMNRCKMQGLLNRFETAIERVLKKGGMQPQGIHRVIMTGGSCQWYFVGEILAKKMDLGGVGDIIHSPSPDTDVANGLAIKRGRTDEPDDTEGDWVRYSIDERKWEEKCLFHPGRISREENCVLLATIDGTQYLRQHRIEFEFLRGIERESATLLGRAEVVVPLRSNLPQIRKFKNAIDALRGRGTSPLDDTYAITLAAKDGESTYRVIIKGAKDGKDGNSCEKERSLRFSRGDRARFTWGGLSRRTVREDFEPDKTVQPKENTSSAPRIKQFVQSLIEKISHDKRGENTNE